MKKLIALILLAALALSLCACSPITGVVVLWADGDTAVNPNSLINSMDRAMYIENIKYAYHGAQGDAARQLQQAEEVLKAGCTVLMVEPVDPAAAQQFVDLAKAANTAVVFFGKTVDDTVVNGYEKCYAVKTDETTLEEKQAEMIAEYLKDKKVVKNLDRNGDGKIAVANDTGTLFDLKVENVEFTLLDSVDGPIDPAVTELVLTANDSAAKGVLTALQEQDFNTDKLTTQYVAIFTVGNTVDYKALVLEGAPGEAEARKTHFEANKYLCDLTAVAEEDLDEMLFTTLNVIDTGRITGTTMEDHDGIAVAAAKAAAAISKCKAGEQLILVPYTTYAG